MVNSTELQKAPVVTIEVYRAFVARRQFLVLEVSVKGREGTFKREWPLWNGQLEESTYEDVEAWCQDFVRDAILISLGVRGVLFP